MIKTVEVEIDLSDFSDQDLLEEMEDRELSTAPDQVKLDSIYEEFRRRGDAPQVLRDFLYEQIGRTL